MNINTVKAHENLDEPEKAFELDNVAVRLVRTREPLMSDEVFDSPDSVVRALSEQMRDFDREVLGVINLDNRMRPINVSFVSAGSVNGTLSHPREILKAAILSNAANMMLIHNHPSGYLIPSKMDVQITDRMIQLCDLVNIPLLDHIIVGIDTSDYSFGYIAGWSADKELSELKASLETIRKTSSGLITDIEDKLEKLRLDKDMNVSEQASKNVTESRPNVTESVTGELQHSRDMMMAALGSTGDLLSSYENKASGNVTESVTVVAEEKVGYESRMSVREAIENREHTYHSAYADIGMVLDNYTTDELIEYLKNNEPGGESSLRNYVESQIIGAQINRERYQSENNFVTESVTDDMTYEPDIEQTTGMRI